MKGQGHGVWAFLFQIIVPIYICPPEAKSSYSRDVQGFSALNSIKWYLDFISGESSHCI